MFTRFYPIVMFEIDDIGGGAVTVDEGLTETPAQDPPAEVSPEGEGNQTAPEDASSTPTESEIQAQLDQLTPEQIAQIAATAPAGTIVHRMAQMAQERNEALAQIEELRNQIAQTQQVQQQAQQYQQPQQQFQQPSVVPQHLQALGVTADIYDPESGFVNVGINGEEAWVEGPIGAELIASRIDRQQRIEMQQRAEAQRREQATVQAYADCEATIVKNLDTALKASFAGMPEATLAAHAPIVQRLINDDVLNYARANGQLPTDAMVAEIVNKRVPEYQRSVMLLANETLKTNQKAAELAPVTNGGAAALGGGKPISQMTPAERDRWYEQHAESALNFG